MLLHAGAQIPKTALASSSEPSREGIKVGYFGAGLCHENQHSSSIGFVLQHMHNENQHSITKTSVGFRYTCMCWFSLYVLVFVMHVLYMSGTCLRVRGNQVLYMCYTFQGNELLP